MSYRLSALSGGRESGFGGERALDGGQLHILLPTPPSRLLAALQ